MINKHIIVDALAESHKKKQIYLERYQKSDNAVNRQFYKDAYIRALDLYSARYQMLLAFGYDVITDENNNIIGIKTI